MEIDLLASWSPDGSKIIYMRDPAEGTRDTSWEWGAFLYDVSSGVTNSLWPAELLDGFSWSPDSRQLAFVKSAQIYIYDFESQTTKQLTHQNRNFSVRWSPCGDILSFCVRTNDGGLYLYDLEADSLIHVVDRIQGDAADWMSNCSTLVMHDSTWYDPSCVVTYNIYTRDLRVIARLSGYKREISLSPDGQTVVFGIENDLWSLGVSDGKIHQLTTEGGGYPDWSPDGQWIVYTKIDRRNGYLWLMRPDGSEKHQITF